MVYDYELSTHELRSKHISHLQGRVKNFKTQIKTGEDLTGAIKVLFKLGFPPIKITTQSRILWKAGDDLAGAIICPTLQVRYVFRWTAEIRLVVR